MRKKKKRYRWPASVIKQAKEIFGIKLTMEDLDGLAKQIRSGDAYLVDRMSKSIMLYMVMLPGTNMTQARAVYSAKKSRVLDFMRPEDV